MTIKTGLAVVFSSAAFLSAGVTGAGASAPPVGPLPKGPVSTTTTQKGQLVAVALPRKTQGLVWRLARPVRAAVLREVSEANVGSTVVVVFRATGSGTARVVFALTRGETAHAFAASTQVVTVK
jgi:hypothetical protein